MASQCTALNVSDEQQCRAEATNLNGLFCRFHARQVQAMYRGYKIRNAKLDYMNANPPEYLTKSKAALRNETFETVEDEEALNELHDYLFQKSALLDRVIRARNLHHSRFYSLNMDYGHKTYLDKLLADRIAVHSALEKLWKRAAEVLHSKAKWFRWVRQRQDEEEATREKEAQRVKRENQMFRRHMKVVEMRLKEERKHEDAKRQEAYPNQVYSERMAERGDMDAEDGDDSDWDPVEDIIEGERDSFVNMMKRLLWLDEALARAGDIDERETGMQSASPPKMVSPSLANKENVDPQTNTSVKEASQSTALTRAQKKRAKAKAKATEAKKDDFIDPLETPKIESAIKASDNPDPQPVEGPAERYGKIPGIPADEVNKILSDVAKIKELLFGRLLLSQAAVLPAALRAGSVEEFLADPEVSREDLRDLCLRVEQPQLQEIRDACADLIRGDAGEEDEAEDEEQDEQTAADRALAAGRKRREALVRRNKGELPDQWRSKHEEAVERRKEKKLHQLREEGGKVPTLVDFGEIEDGTLKNKRIRFKVCGRTIWNYPSDKAMAREGWLQYSIIAKGSRMEDSIVLCRNWLEFWELNALTIFGYFPAVSWSSWAGDRVRQQQLHQGFVPNLQYNLAEQMTDHQQNGSRARGPRMHEMREHKNSKRNDAVSRRFVQYLSMQSGRLCLLVRDAKTGRILVKPPEEHLWIVWYKSGMGHASKNEWVEAKKVGEDMFEMLSTKEAVPWRFGFNEYYDLQIWDLQPG
ncbi:hypothetical protein LTR85_004340 [Meristemomyces frigidus]|nr:hypothetical protein LTR85_004340 [Meristemomyces frigidus]